MRGQNRVLGDGPISRLPLIIGIVISSAVISALFFLGPGRADKEQEAPQAQGASEAGAFKAMLARGESVIAKDEKLLAERRRRERGPQNEDLSPEELRQKALALSEEARQASDYADSLEGVKRPEGSAPAFEDDYRAYAGKERERPAPKAEPQGGPGSVQMSIRQDPGRQARLQAFEQALRSPSRIELKKDSAQEQAKTAKLPAQAPAAPGGRDDRYRTLSEYSLLEGGGGHVLDSRVEAMKTPWCLRQGSVIPAVLVTAVNSDLPGQVTAQVPSDVLDSVRGSDVLIPAGTMIAGQYGASPGYGAERLFIAFSRLLFPDGTSLSLGAMPGQGPDGAGFESDTDSHFLRMFTGSFLVSAVSASVSASQMQSGGSYTYGSALGQSAGDSLGQTLSRILERNLNLSPTLSVKPGYSFSVAVTRDIYFNGPYGTEAFSR